MVKTRPMIIIILGIAILLIVSFVFPDDFVGAGDSDAVSGWAWSDTIGWISFNCTDDSCANSNYGVDLNLGTNDFSGYAWSENIGWIDFAPSGPYPASPNYFAKKDEDKVKGWIRAVNYDGDWDGWILLGDNSGKWETADSTQISINSETKEFEGWAWGGEVVGWITFNCNGPGICN